MNTRIKPALSLILTLCLLLSVFPGSAMAAATEDRNSLISVDQSEEYDPNASEMTPIVQDAQVAEEVTVLWEDETLRGEYEKHFLMSDGSYQAVVYSYPVHELVDGAWVEVENANQNSRTNVAPSNAKSNIIDNYVREGYGVQNNNGSKLYIGRITGNKVRAFIRFATMPTIPEGATITSATMTVNIVSGTSTANSACAYQVDSEWESGTIQWSNMPSLGTLQASNISHNNKTKYQFSCLEAVKDWYSNSTTGQHQNYGIMIRYADETIADYNSFYSADCTDAGSRPSLVINYTKEYPTTTWVDISVDNNYILLGNTKQVNCTTSSTNMNVTWVSNNPDIATVSSSGLVTAKSEGQVRISAVYYGSSSAAICSDYVDIGVYTSLGLDEGTKYYIMNYNSRRLMSLETVADTNYTNVGTRARYNYNYSQWTLERQADGRFQLVNGYSNTNKVLHASGTNLNIYTDINAESEKFTICRINSGTYAGLYYIRHGAYYVAQDANNNVYLAPSPSNIAVWSFFAVDPGYANAFTHNYHYTEDDYQYHFDTSVNNSRFVSLFSSYFYYTSNASVNDTASNAFNTLHREQQQIFVFMGHGGPGIIGFYEEDNVPTGGIYADSVISNRYIDRDDKKYISDLSNNELSDLRCVLYLGCSTGDDIIHNGVTYNTVNATYEKGAHFVLGTTETLNTGHINDWLEYFLRYISDGENIKDACSYASRDLGIIEVPSGEFVTVDGKEVELTKEVDGLPTYYVGDDIQYLKLP